MPICKCLKDGFFLGTARVLNEHSSVLAFEHEQAPRHCTDDAVTSNEIFYVRKATCSPER